MFDNVGRKIQILAMISFWVCVIVSSITGILIWIQEGELLGFFKFLFVAVGGSFAGWISSLFVYGFGELIENVARIENNSSCARFEGIVVKKSDEKS